MFSSAIASLITVVWNRYERRPAHYLYRLARGVDDARELRERAFYTPVARHFKIYIIDEAHMVTQQGFNALLKLVKERRRT